MNVVAFLKESSLGSINSVIGMAKVIIPLMIVMELLRDSNIFETLSKKLGIISDFFGISNETVFPIVIGLVFGLAYGAGLIIESTDGKDLSKKDIYVMAIFLVACHAIFEDTLIFAAVGSNLLIIFATRLILAALTAFLVSKAIDRFSDTKALDKSK